MTSAQPVPPPNPPSPSGTTFSIGDWLTLLGFIVTVLFGVVTILPQSPSSITYQVSEPVPVIDIAESVSNDVVVYSNGIVVKKLFLTRVNFINNSDVVRKEDYEMPIRVNFDKSCKVLSKNFVDLSPKNIKIQFDKNKTTVNTIQLAPTNLNKGDRFSIKFLIGECKVIPTVEGRVIGVSELKQVNLDGERSRNTIALMLSTVICAIMFSRIQILRAQSNLLGSNIWINLLNNIPLNIVIFLFAATVLISVIMVGTTNTQPYEGLRNYSSGEW